MATVTGASPEPPRWRPAGFFVLRCPLLAAAEARALARGVAEAIPLPLPEESRAAIALASPDLSEGLARPGGAPAASRALERYLLRMGLRPTPVGWLSGVSVGGIGGQTSLRLGPRTAHQFHLRLSPPALAAIARRAGAALADRPARYRPASTLVVAGGEIRFRPLGQLATTAATPAVLRALEAASGGATLGEIAARLSPDPRAVGAFLKSLVDGQLLISELVPPITGPEPLRSLRDAVARLAPGEDWARQLDELGEELASAERPGASRVLALGSRVRALAAVEVTHPLDGQLHLHAPGLSLGPEPVRELLEVARCLWSWRRPGPPRELRDFARRFEERFGAAEVPLGVAVDPHLGVGYGHERGALASPPLLAPVTEEAAAVREEVDQRLASLASEALAQAGGGRAVLRLQESDVPEDDGEPLPAAFAVLATVAGDFRVLQPALSTGPAALLARFCHASPTLHRHTLELAQAEARLEDGALLADVVLDAPGDRGAMAWRPCLYPFEIPCGGVSGAPLDRQIPLSDLLVSVEHSEVKLRSRRHGRPVRIRISAAIDAASPVFPPAYRFLGALADRGAGGWSWRGLRRWPHLPRVELGRSVLAPETWHLTRGGAHGLPRWISLVGRGGEALPLDLEAPLEAAVLRRALQREGTVTVMEDLEGEGALLVQGPEGGYRHQLVVPFLADANPGVRRRSTTPAPETSRSIHPAGPVLSAKLYADPLTLDWLAVAVAKLARGRAGRWHFLKYRDPESHLRFRLLDVPAGGEDALLAELHSAVAGFRDRGRLWRTQLDTYEREQERYGGPDGIGHAEAVFAADSDACAELLEALGRVPEARGLVIAASAHALLSDLVPALRARREILADLESTYAREQGGGREVRARLGLRFRAYRPLLLSIGRGEIPEPFQAPLRERSEAVRAIWAKYEPVLSAPGRLLAVKSLVHMSVCRLQGDDVRREELTLYGLLRRALDELLHRQW